DDVASAFVDPLASVLHGWRRLANPSGRLLVYGAGALAWLWAAVATRRGMDVAVAGRRPERATLATLYGARFVDLSGDSDVLASAGLFDAAVDATGDREVWGRLPGLVRPGGQVLLFGGCAPGATATFDAERLHYAEVAVVGSFHYTPEEARAALEALASGEVDPRPLVSARGTLSDLPRFLEDQKRGLGVRYAVGAAA
ncbi:MAG TPA: zinc-binding dehydrogenase, partial [Thermoanaerobaculia bacterium]|nr:zinc-binding dehydrogenase [Thermoanaerobaculia bacterium]